MSVKPLCIQEISSKGPFGSIDTCVKHCSSGLLKRCFEFGPLESLTSVEKWEEVLGEIPSPSLFDDVSFAVSLLPMFFLDRGVKVIQSVLPEGISKAFSYLKYPALVFSPTFRAVATTAGIADCVCEKVSDYVIGDIPNLFG